MQSTAQNASGSGSKTAATAEINYLLLFREFHSGLTLSVALKAQR